MPKTLTTDEAAARLLAEDDILLLTHRRPDGDTNGCAAALCLALRAVGKRTFVAQNPGVTARYTDMLAPLWPEEGFRPRFVAAVDIADAQLIPPEFSAYGAVRLNVDHHPSNTLFAEETLLDASCGACGEIVLDLVAALGAPLTRDIAQALYIAVATDTGCFRYSNASARTLRAAAACLDAGVKAGPLNRIYFETKTRARCRLEGYVFENMRFAKGGALAAVAIPRALLDELGATDDDIDSIASLPRQVEGVEMAITAIGLRAGGSKVSVRTGEGYDASAFCRRFGGGGHLRASGCELDETPERAAELLLAAAQE